MPQLALNKSSLHRESHRLRQFQRVLPSLDLKRRQLIAERSRAAAELAETRSRLQTLREGVSRQLPMLAYREVDLAGLARVTEVRLGERNVMGTRLPTLESVEVELLHYGRLARPHWVDAVALRLREALDLEVRVQVQQERLRRFEAAVARATQRVNLFDKVLIPRSRERIRRIRLFLADMERAAVVRAKLAKRKRQAEGHR